MPRNNSDGKPTDRPKNDRTVPTAPDTIGLHWRSQVPLSLMRRSMRTPAFDANGRAAEAFALWHTSGERDTGSASIVLRPPLFPGMSERITAKAMFEKKWAQKCSAATVDIFVT